MAPKVATFSDYPIREVAEDASLPESNKARALLERLRRHSEPILKERGWTVLRLIEIDLTGWKKHRRVLGWCQPAGDKVTSECIQILLRRFPRMDFIPFDSLIGTMLHEITHIVHGQHRAPFYRLMDQLRNDHSRLLGSVLDEMGLPEFGGQRLGGAFGFRGQRLGGSSRASPPLAESSPHMPPPPAAPISRQSTGGKHRGPKLGRGRKLGGASRRTWSQLSPRERAARAAERRAAHDKANGLDDELPWPGDVPSLDLVGAFERGLDEASRSDVAASSAAAPQRTQQWPPRKSRAKIGPASNASQSSTTSYRFGVSTDFASASAVATTKRPRLPPQTQARTAPSNAVSAARQTMAVGFSAPTLPPSGSAHHAFAASAKTETQSADGASDEALIAVLSASGQAWENESLQKAIEASTWDMAERSPVVDLYAESFHTALHASTEAFGAQMVPQDENETLARSLSLEEAARVAALEAEEQRQLELAMAASLAGR